MGTVEKVFLGFTITAVVATIFTSQYSAGIFGSLSGGIADIYSKAKH